MVAHGSAMGRTHAQSSTLCNGFHHSNGLYVPYVPFVIGQNRLHLGRGDAVRRKIETRPTPVRNCCVSTDGEWWFGHSCPKRTRPLAALPSRRKRRARPRPAGNTHGAAGCRRVCGAMLMAAAWAVCGRGRGPLARSRPPRAVIARVTARFSRRGRGGEGGRGGERRGAPPPTASAQRRRRQRQTGRRGCCPQPSPPRATPPPPAGSRVARGRRTPPQLAEHRPAHSCPPTSPSPPPPKRGTHCLRRQHGSRGRSCRLSAATSAGAAGRCGGWWCIAS